MLAYLPAIMPQLAARVHVSLAVLMAALVPPAFTSR